MQPWLTATSTVMTEKLYTPRHQMDAAMHMWWEQSIKTIKTNRQALAHGNRHMHAHSMCRVEQVSRGGRSQAQPLTWAYAAGLPAMPAGMPRHAHPCRQLPWPLDTAHQNRQHSTGVAELHNTVHTLHTQCPEPHKTPDIALCLLQPMHVMYCMLQHHLHVLVTDPLHAQRKLPGC
jgi:hypothetical protein